MTKVINLFAGPGSGKSTLAAGLFYKLKNQGISCELVREYAKELCWAGVLAMTSQTGILREQAHRMEILRGKVDFVITDSPLLLTCIYCANPHVISEAVRLHATWDNQNIFVRRVKPYSTRGRDQTEPEAIMLDRQIRSLLMTYPHTEVDGDDLGLEEIRGSIAHQAAAGK